MDNNNVSRRTNQAETFSGYTVSPNNIAEPAPRLRKTKLLGERLRHLADTGPHAPHVSASLLRLSRKLLACDLAFKTGGNRCSQASCPRCQRTAAIRFRKRVEKVLGNRPKEEFWLFTATIATDDLMVGHHALQLSLQKLKRRKHWLAAVAGGVIQCEFKLSESGSIRRWNVHSHAILELKPGTSLDNGQIQAMWSAYLANHNLVGDTDLRIISKRGGHHV